MDPLYDWYVRLMRARKLVSLCVWGGGGAAGAGVAGGREKGRGGGGREKAITRKRIPVFTPHENQMGTSILY